MKCTKFLRSGFVLIALGVAGAASAQVEGEYQIQPIFTRYAETVKKITFNSSLSLFHDVQLQEADEFNGWSVDADLTIPIPYTKTFQLRLEWPFYTDGRARVIDNEAPDRGERKRACRTRRRHFSRAHRLAYRRREHGARRG